MTDKSGPAFPRPGSTDNTGWHDLPNDGITHRQWLAGLAMQALATKPWEKWEHLASAAYAAADAMIAHEESEK